MVVDILTVFYYEKMVGYTPSSFADLVFTYERIEVGLKRGKFNHPAWTNEKTGANEEGENEGETHAATIIPIQPSFPRPLAPMLNTTLSTNQNTNQGRNFAAKSL